MFVSLKCTTIQKKEERPRWNSRASLIVSKDTAEDKEKFPGHWDRFTERLDDNLVFYCIHLRSPLNSL